jgi:tRNA threonylcarbamoyl adenosine modification protein YeaZ
MKMLALEFSSHQRSVAVSVNGSVRGSAMETATRTTHAFALIEQALQAARLEREEIECVAIGIGPGSYHGIRASIALAQGWQLALPVKLLGISSAECLAAEAQAKSIFGKVSVIIDAQRGEFCFARYEISAEVCRKTAALKLATLEEARAQAVDGAIVGPEANRWFPEGRILFPNAPVLAKLAETRTDFIEGEKLEPIYLRETNFVKAAPVRVLPEG